jgi:UDP-N-acetylmuramate--alanine ligase
MTGQPTRPHPAATSPAYRPVEVPAGADTPDQAHPLAGRRIFAIGIGGCGVSGLALMLKDLGAICSGSDSTPSEFTARLLENGITVSHEQTAEALPADIDLVIASAAIPPDHPQMLAAQQRGLPVHTYAEALGMLQQHRTGISVAGTHGKSTTVSMLCHILITCKLDPSFIVGASCDQIGGGSRVGGPVIPGDGPYASRPGLLVCEACEFNRSFHHHRPTIGLINNIEEDHLDIYGSLENVIAAFGEFARLLPPASAGGRLLIAHDGAHRGQITPGLACTVETFGFHPEATYQVVYDPAVQRVGLLNNGLWLTQWTNPLPGAHNALNAAAAVILAHMQGVDWELAAQTMAGFQGVHRRLERLGERQLPTGRVVVYDDYGHHPSEIEATLKALRSAENPKRLICVFQPHQHSRTRFLLEQFAQSFEHADEVIVPHIYFVRDSEIEKTRVSAADLVDRLRQRDVRAMHLYPFQAIVEQLERTCGDGDLLVIMGAGPVWKVGHEFIERGEHLARADAS